MLSTMPLPVALLIAPHLNPYKLLQAARVNRVWYESFMSDAVWHEWDVYGVGKNIAKPYLTLKLDVTSDQWGKFDALPSDYVRSIGTSGSSQSAETRNHHVFMGRIG